MLTLYHSKSPASRRDGDAPKFAIFIGPRENDDDLCTQNGDINGYGPGNSYGPWAIHRTMGQVPVTGVIRAMVVYHVVPISGMSCFILYMTHIRTVGHMKAHLVHTVGRKCGLKK